MAHCRRIRLAVLLATCLIVTRGLWAQLKAGVVVESVPKYSQGEKAGLQEGDVLTSWSRGEAKGELQSPFDLSLIEIEQAPRGTVALEGLRGADKRTWAIGPDEWRLKTRPALPQDLLATYLEGEELAKAGKSSEAADWWRAAALEVHQLSNPRLAAWFFFHTAEMLASDKRWKEVDEAYQQALQESERAAPEVAAQLLQKWASTYEQRGTLAQAEKLSEQALAQSQKLDPETLLTAAFLQNLCSLSQQQSSLEKAGEYCRRALVIQQKAAPDSLARARTLVTQGQIALTLGADLAKAEDFFHQALAIRERLAPDSLGVSSALNFLCITSWYRGDLTTAEDYGHRALIIRERLAPGSHAVADALNNLGNVAFDRGDLGKAEDYQRRALAIREKISPAGSRVANSLNNLGSIAFARDDLAKAQEYYSRALTLQQKSSPDSYEVSNALNNLGVVCQASGDLEKAEEYYKQAMVITEKLAPASLDAAKTLESLGETAYAGGDLSKAEDYCHRAQAIEQKLAPESLLAGTTQKHLGDIARDRGDLISAEHDYRQSLVLRQKLAPGSLDHAESLAALAALTARRQQPRPASQLYQQALDTLENQISRLGAGEEIRSQFRAKHAGYYKHYIDLLVSQNQADVAFQVLERLHARSLLEILAAAHIDIHQGVDHSLLEQERALQQLFNTKSNRRVQLLGEKYTQDQLAALDKEINDVLGKYQDVEEQIRASSPTYAALTQPKPLSAKEIQQQLLDPTTLLLEYSLGEDRSYVFVVNPDSLTATPLPKRATIERLARQVYSSLTARNSRHKGETLLEWQGRVSKSEADYLHLARQFSQMVLGPVAAQLKGKRLLIVSDGALHYIPFAALPDPQPFSPGQPALPLMVRHEIVNLPSASVLSVLRAQHAGRTKPPKLVAVLADPVFDNQDARLRYPSAAERNVSNGATRGPDTTEDTKEDTQGQDAEEEDFAGRELTRSAADVGLQEKGEVRFPRLQLTRREAQDILAVTPPGQGMEALDFNASRATALNPNLAQYRIVHFATHGLLDSQHPELSGLVLSLVNEQGKKQNGFLGLQDIYNMNLSADLVVLSACETGLGKQVEGEGLLSLTRGFMYAGAPRIVASLWKIDDLATASLMKEFYKAMEQQGERPAAALRQAQLEMWKTHRWSPPYFWAAFQIQGEWK